MKFALGQPYARVEDPRLITGGGRGIGIVEAGTGVGKSLAYLVPIVDHVLKNNPADHSVRAIIVYPMNALVNSQLAALETFRKNWPECPLTFDRYTGQDRGEKRHRLLTDPPFDRRALYRVDAEVRDSMGLISERQYEELFQRYIQHVSHWVKGERLRNRLTGELEKADEGLMSEMEGIVMPKSEDSGEFRRGLIAAVGAHKLDNPDAQMEYPRIFPDVFRRLRDHFYEERKRILKRNRENVLKFLSPDERGALTAKERVQVEDTLKTMASRYGYCEHCAKDAILFVMRERYS